MSKTKTKPTVGANAPLLEELQCAIDANMASIERTAPEAVSRWTNRAFICNDMRITCRKPLQVAMARLYSTIAIRSRCLSECGLSILNEQRVQRRPFSITEGGKRLNE